MENIISQPVVAGHGWFAGAVRKVVTAVTKKLQQGRAIRQLSSLSDRQLADIGIDRFQIPLIVAGLVDHSPRS